MKITSAVITLITAATAVCGATLKSREHHGANQTSRAGARTHAGKRAAALTCPTSGFHPPGQPSCVCNFAGACDPLTNAHTPAAAADLTNLVGIAPQHIDKLAYGTKNVGTVCENGVVATLYDCNARTSLYAATVIGSGVGSGMRKDCWKSTTDAKLIKHKNLLAIDDDYKDSSKHIYCFEDTGKEFEWDGVTACPTRSPTSMPIHKGHLIAARYGKVRGNVDATFTYTNAVPQVGGFNSGKWRTHEAKVTKLAADCQTNAPAGISIQVYIVVGVVPSTFLGKPRFFGAAGFGGFQGFSKLHGKTTLEYRISFPEIMWTAACCVHSDGTVDEKLAFWRRNWPDKSDKVSEFKSTLLMFMDMQAQIRSIWGKAFVIPKVFPGKAGCDL